MKKRSLRILPLMMALLLVCNLFLASVITPRADTTDVSGCENVLAGKLPIAIYAADAGSFETNWKGSVLQGTGLNQYSGHTYSDVGYTDAAVYKNAAIPHLAMLTDEDDATSCRISPEYNGGTAKVIVFDLGKTGNVKAVEILCKSYAADADLYLSTSRTGLFGSANQFGSFQRDAGAQTTSSLQSAGKKARYLGIYMKNVSQSGFDEIKVYAEKEETGPTTLQNVLAEQLPTAVYAAAKDSFETNWMGSILQGTGLAEYRGHTYSDVGYTDYVGYKNAAIPHLAALTDEDEATGCRITPEDGNGTSEVIVYDLGESMSVKAVEILCNSYDEDADVYLSNARNSLFNDTNKIGSFKRGDNAYQTDSRQTVEKRARYVGIHMNYVYQTGFTEIRVFAEIQQIDVTGLENPIKGRLPAAVYAADPGSFETNWRASVLCGTGLEQYHGHTYSDRGYTDYALYKDSAAPHLAMMTDGKSDTKCYVSAEPGQPQNEIIVYDLGDTYDIRAVKLDAASETKNIDVYFSSGRDTVFYEAKRAAEYGPTTRSLIGVSANKVRYVGLNVRGDTGTDIAEIEVYGKKYQRPDYGTNLLAGKGISRIYIAERGYPLVNTGDEFDWYTKFDNYFSMMTDGDLTTGYSLMPEKPLQKVTKNSRYIAVSFDIDTPADIDKIVVTTSAAGFDLFVSNDYTNLFADINNRVYTSNGDQRLEDGSLDSSTDLEPDEEFPIDLNGVTGRYVGLVITRAAAIGKDCWETVRINEVEVFGTAHPVDYGDNILRGKVPISHYRAAYGAYEVSLGDLAMSGEKGTEALTNGNTQTLETYTMFPNNNGYISYDYGAGVMIYYLGATCDINAFSIYTQFYTGLGGVDVYAAEKYKDLFNESSLMFTTNGTVATDKIYDAQWDLGASTIKAAFDHTVKGRYVAFVFTRACDSRNPVWAYYRIREIELYGKEGPKETLPSTTVYDKKTGSSAEFEFQNPDQRFDFGAKGIASLELQELADSEYKSDIFDEALTNNGLEAKGKAFRIRFLDKKGKQIPDSALAGQKVKLSIKLKNKDVALLGEIYKDVAHVYKFAQQTDDRLEVWLEDFDYKFILLGYASGPAADTDNGILPANREETDFGRRETDTWDDPDGDNGSPEHFVTDEPNEGQAENVSKKATPVKKRWVVVQSEDPLEWFWNIYDTFAANPWMLIVCCAVLALGIGSVIFGAVFFARKKKRSRP